MDGFAERFGSRWESGMRMMAAYRFDVAVAMDKCVPNVLGAVVKTKSIN